MVLFEEFGGNPSLVNFQTITIGSVCGNAYESNNTLELSCNECPISSIKFASFGTPQGTCGSFQKGSCESTRDTLSILQNVCKFLDVYFYYLLLLYIYIYIYLYIYSFSCEDYIILTKFLF